MLQGSEREMLVQALRSYVANTLHIRVQAATWDRASTLPFYLQERYEFLSVELLGHAYALMVDNHLGRFSPAQTAKDAGEISARGGIGAIYTTDSLSSTDRSRLVKHGVPFIVPGKQMYLPPLGIDFRERFGRAPATKDHVGPAAQVLVLAYLYRLWWASSTPTEIAAEIGYSKMSIGRAFSEIQSAGLGKIRQAGKEKTLVFDVSGRALWEKAVGMLRNPITSVRHEERKGEVGREEVYLSGLSALSSYTDLAEPSIPTHAIWNRAHSARAGGDTQSYEEGAQETIVERWAYNPAYFNEAGRVDRLSLYLSLRDSEDERVELALHHLLEGVDW